MIKLLSYLSIGTAAMLLPVLIQSAWYKIKWYKALLMTVLLTVAGTLGAYLMFFVENRWLGGTSFYGAVFLVPVLFLPLGKLLKLSYGTLMDLCAPAECMMLAIMKIQCLLNGCCDGRMLCLGGMEFQFPSQAVELINALVILVVLMLMGRKTKHKGSLYPWYMLIYGISRFVLNFFREDTGSFLLGMAPGTFWSVCSTVLGLVALIWIRGRKKSSI